MKIVIISGVFVMAMILIVAIEIYLLARDNLTFEEKERAEHIKRLLVFEQNGKCAHCGLPLCSDDLIDTSHIISKAKANLRKWGVEIIHHPLNLKATHHNDTCNNGVGLNPATHPVEADNHVRKIKEDLADERDQVQVMG